MSVLDRPPLAPGAVGDGVGASARRPDGPPKVQGAFAYSSDLRRDGMLFGATTRSPHPHARILAVDTSAAEALDGVRCVLTHEDVPGRPTFGLVLPDQPVLASDRVRFHGEAVAIVAADDLATARAAARLVRVAYEPLPVLSDPEQALDPGSVALHPGGNVLRHLPVLHGDVDAHAHEAEVVIRGEYAVGTQDQAPLGPESGLAVPRPDGGVDLHIATQWLHADRDQVAACLALEPGQVRLVAAGTGGAFGAREDLTMQVHACLLALRTGRPVQLPYTRQESFLAHVHRHPARMAYEHGATRDGRLVYVRARLLMDGGAYASTSIPVVMVAASFLAGPYAVPHAAFDARVVYTNNPPCGAMRGFGAVQVCFGYEAQMDRLAAAVGLSPLELRRRNALATGGRLPTGQPVHGPAPVRELLDHLDGLPAPAEPAQGLPDGVRRGTGYAVGIKNIGFSEGFDDFSTARVALRVDEATGDPVASVRTAACEVGQGVVTVQAQIARTELGVARVDVLEADTEIRNAGPASASRHTLITGGAVHAACVAVADRVLELAGVRLARLPSELALAREAVADRVTGERLIGLGELLGGEVVEEEREFRPRATVPLDERGQGDCHATFSFAAHRVVADVDVELGTVRLVEVATVQDVGKAVNPQAVEGQMEGGTAQGLGLALMEDLRSEGGVVLNGSFGDYLVPTSLDVPPIATHVLELAQPDAPYGVNGVGEAPTVSAGAAVLAALRDATGRELPRAPASLADLSGT
jgi:xanthine dehydrogenase D subunit